jgi:uncharacterized protein YmfQ (DUF2313 family)
MASLRVTWLAFLDCFAQELQRFEDRESALLQESFPSKTTELVAEWEAELLRQDEMPVGTENIAQRREVLAAKYRQIFPGPSRQFFTELAESLGIVVLITDAGDYVDSTVARVDEARVDEARVSDETDAFHWQIAVLADPSSQLTKYQALVELLKPAHTIPVYI